MSKPIKPSNLPADAATDAASAPVVNPLPVVTPTPAAVEAPSSENGAPPVIVDQETCSFEDCLALHLDSRPSVTAAAFSLTLPGSCIQAGFPADSKSGISSSPIVTIPSEMQIYSVPVIDLRAPKYLPDGATNNPHVLVVKANITTEGSSPVRIVSHARNLNDVLVLDSFTGSATPVPISRSPLHGPAYPPCIVYEATKDSTNTLVFKDSTTLLLADLQSNLFDLRATEYLQADDNFHLHGLSFEMPLLSAF